MPRTGAGIYLTRPNTDQLLAELGLERCPCPMMSATFNDAPMYLDRDVSMVTCHDRAGEAYLAFV